MKIRGKQIEIPAPPVLLPEDLKAKWRADYEDEYREAVESTTDENFDQIACNMAALRVANKVLRVRAPKTYDEAAALPSWQVLAKKEQDGKLTVVTIDAKKYRFDSPGAEMLAQTPDEGFRPELGRISRTG